VQNYSAITNLQGNNGVQRTGPGTLVPTHGKKSCSTTITLRPKTLLGGEEPRLERATNMCALQPKHPHDTWTGKQVMSSSAVQFPLVTLQCPLQQLTVLLRTVAVRQFSVLCKHFPHCYCTNTTGCTGQYPMSLDENWSVGIVSWLPRDGTTSVSGSASLHHKAGESWSLTFRTTKTSSQPQPRHTLEYSNACFKCSNNNSTLVAWDKGLIHRHPDLAYGFRAEERNEQALQQCSTH
jgi:hypothetical protein